MSEIFNRLEQLLESLIKRIEGKKEEILNLEQKVNEVNKNIQNLEKSLNKVEQSLSFWVSLSKEEQEKLINDIVSKLETSELFINSTILEKLKQIEESIKENSFKKIRELEKTIQELKKQLKNIKVSQTAFVPIGSKSYIDVFDSANNKVGTSDRLKFLNSNLSYDSGTKTIIIQPSGGGGGGIGGSISTGQIAFGTGTNTIGGDNSLTWDNANKLLLCSNGYFQRLELENPLEPQYGGTGLSSLGSANQIIGVDSTTSFLEYKTIQGTANQINVTHSTEAITLSTPQNISPTSSPTFSGLTLTGNLNKIKNVSYNWPSTQGGAGTVLTNDGGGNLSWSSSGGGFSYSVWHILNPINTNTWYVPYATNATAFTTLTLTANRIYYIPFVPQINVTITSLAVEVTTAATGTGQIGIYDTSNYRPNSLLGSVNIDTGTTGVKSGSVSINLQAGQLYWLALICGGTPTIRAVAVASVQSIMGIAAGVTAWNTHYNESGSGGTLPSTAGANGNGTGVVPTIYIRY